MDRPSTFECPWCGPNGVPVDHTLPIFLRLCMRCLPYPTVETVPVPVASPAIPVLREILYAHVRDWARPWPGAEFGKTIIGNALLGALQQHGCDPQSELRTAVEQTQRHLHWRG